MEQILKQCWLVIVFTHCVTTPLPPKGTMNRFLQCESPLAAVRLAFARKPHLHIIVCLQSFFFVFFLYVCVCVKGGCWVCNYVTVSKQECHKCHCTLTVFREEETILQSESFMPERWEVNTCYWAEEREGAEVKESQNCPLSAQSQLHLQQQTLNVSLIHPSFHPSIYVFTSLLDGHVFIPLFCDF